jgi:hypothetical protein
LPHVFGDVAFFFVFHEVMKELCRQTFAGLVARVQTNRLLSSFARPDGPFDFAQGRLGRLSSHKRN